ncbi:hypothetical protein [Nocardia aobensis]|nr:hypothetical protein [Nocardia aobensis]
MDATPRQIIVTGCLRVDAADLVDVGRIDIRVTEFTVGDETPLR